jgi:hypothetical protein
MDRLVQGYFASPVKVSRGPWFREIQVEDDGLDYYYVYKNQDNKKKYLLSNNVALKDRVGLENVYTAYKRNYLLSTFAGLWAGAEIVTRVGYFKKMAPGYRLLSFVALGLYAAEEFRYYSAGYYYMPLLCSYFKKYDKFAKEDIFDIKDEKREWFELDTSQYMSYDFKDLDHHHHNANHGPQPEGESLDSSWYIEMNKFLKGEPNKLKEHPKYRDYNFDYSDKYHWPSTELVHQVFHAKEIEQHTPDSLKSD